MTSVETPGRRASDAPLEALRTVTPEEIRHYKENGWVKLEGLISPEAAAATRERLERRLEGARGKGGFSADSSLFEVLDHLSRDDETLEAFSHSRKLGRVVSDLMGCGRPGVQGVRFWFDNALVKMPAAERGAKTPWHQDEPYGPFDRQGSATVWIALVDMPPERGTLRFYSGSQRLGGLGRHLLKPGFDALDEYPWVADEFDLSPPLHLKPGDATVHMRAVLHSAPANETDEPRWAYQLIFFPAEALVNGMPHPELEGTGLVENDLFDHPRFPQVFP